MTPAPRAPQKLAIDGRVRRWRPRGAMPNGAIFGVTTRGEAATIAIEPGDAFWVSPPPLGDRSSPWPLVELLPEPEAVRGALVVVAPTASASGFFSRLLGAGERTLPRALRGAALLLKGYRAIGGGVDPTSGLDLVWGESLG